MSPHCFHEVEMCVFTIVVAIFPVLKADLHRHSGVFIEWIEGWMHNWILQKGETCCGYKMKEKCRNVANAGDKGKLMCRCHTLVTVEELRSCVFCQQKCHFDPRYLKPEADRRAFYGGIHLWNMINIWMRPIQLPVTRKDLNVFFQECS